MHVVMQGVGGVPAAHECGGAAGAQAVSAGPDAVASGQQVQVPDLPLLLQVLQDEPCTHIGNSNCCRKFLAAVCGAIDLRLLVAQAPLPLARMLMAQARLPLRSVHNTAS